MDDDFRRQRTESNMSNSSLPEYLTVWERYDSIFLLTYTVQSFNGGLKFMFMLAYQDLFKNYYKLQPTHTQVLTTVIFWPWVTKFCYGIIADSIPIFGSRKKSWLVIMGGLQFVSMMIAALVDIDNPNAMACVLMAMTFSGAFIDVIMDALMVIEAKKFPVQGSQELISWSWIVASIAAIIGGILAACILQWSSPFVCFGIYALFGLLVAVTSLLIPPRLEEDQETLEAQIGHPIRTFSQEMAYNYRIVADCMQIIEMKQSLLFFVLIGLTVPRFDDFLYYYKTGPAGFSQFTYSMLTLLGALALIVGIILYQQFFKTAEVRSLIGLAMALTILASFTDLCFVLRWNLAIGVPDLVWVMFSSTALNTFIYAFLVLPPGVLFAKLTPAHVEATMYAFTSSVTAAIYPMSKFLGTAINKLTFDVKSSDLSNLYKLYTIQIALGFMPFLYIWLIPSWKQVAKVQEHLKLKVQEENQVLELTIDTTIVEEMRERLSPAKQKLLN